MADGGEQVTDRARIPGGAGGHRRIDRLCKEVGRYGCGKRSRSGGAQKFTSICETHGLPPRRAPFLSWLGFRLCNKSRDRGDVKVPMVRKIMPYNRSALGTESVDGM